MKESVLWLIAIVFFVVMVIYNKLVFFIVAPTVFIIGLMCGNIRGHIEILKSKVDELKEEVEELECRIDETE
jgi:hypothetical protein